MFYNSSIFVISGVSRKKEEISLPSIQTFEFDLDSSYQSRQFYDNEGNLVTISISRTRSSSNERIISYTSIKLSMSYKILIDNNRITNAYDPSYSTSYWDVTSSNLSVDSSAQATYTLTCKKLLLTTTKWLRANIENGSLVITSH